MQHFESGAKSAQANNLVLSVLNDGDVYGELVSIAEKTVCVDIVKSEAIAAIATICKIEASKPYNVGGDKIKASHIKEATNIIFDSIVDTYIKELHASAEEETLYLTRAKNDVNGNPRYVVHFVDILPRPLLDRVVPVFDKYGRALHTAKNFGGKKYHNKSYGGGIVFSSYNINEELGMINRLTGRNFVDYCVK